MTKTEEFDKAVQGLVNKDRMESYGHPANHFAISSKIKRVLSDAYRQSDPAVIQHDERYLHALEMIADKMARLCHSPDHLDSWIDIAGYARTAVMILDRAAVIYPKEGVAAYGTMRGRIDGDGKI